MVEFVLILPLFVTLIFVLAEAGRTFSDYLRVTDAARVAVRAAAVAPLNGSGLTPCAAAQIAVDRAGGNIQLASCNAPDDPTPGVSQATVTVTHDWSINLPLLGFLSQSGTLSSSATEAIE